MSSKLLHVGMYGGGGVGKTAITLQFVKGEFTEGCIPTIEDSFEKVISLNGESVKLEIIDTAGQDDFKEMRFNYMSKVDGFIFVFSVIEPISLNQVDEIHSDALKAKGTKSVPCVIAANKADLEKTVNMEEADELSKKLGCQVFETSAKTSLNIQKIYEELVIIVSDSGTY
ncbi:small GTP-binding protein [Tritrichomonas foetus]|uniref:Small GTP-binding protein n=1 Tax=Tritrichomonas foetus TaxID=1144522 RepID=A0A1J4JPV8_9EUKA|nr:small GTP-binding protein [Tritrichomonas foetus]|eukprot:OHS99565.1 small GTP-binding protein [Tritrichomonas foetus]